MAFKFSERRKGIECTHCKGILHSEEAMLLCAFKDGISLAADMLRQENDALKAARDVWRRDVENLHKDIAAKQAEIMQLTKLMGAE